MDKDKLVEKLRNNKQRLTPIKSEIIDIFLREAGYLDAASVHRKLQMPSNRSTVYRTLDALYNAGILDIVYKEDKRWFKLVEEQYHKHYVVCEKCGSQKELNFCPFKHINSQIEGYDIKAHTFELIGVCPRCSEEEEACERRNDGAYHEDEE